MFTATALRWLVDRRPKADDAGDRRGNCSADQRRTPTCTEPNDTGCYRVRMETCRSRSAIRHGAGHHGGLDDAEPSHGNHLTLFEAATLVTEADSVTHSSPNRSGELRPCGLAVGKCAHCGRAFHSSRQIFHARKNPRRTFERRHSAAMQRLPSNVEVCMPTPVRGLL